MMHNYYKNALPFLLVALISSPLLASETWIVRTDLWGNPAFSTLTLERSAQTVSGDLDGDQITGEIVENQIRFTAKDMQGQTAIFSGLINGNEISGSADYPDTNDSQARAIHGFKARRIPDRPSGPPRTYQFKPTDYSNSWNADREPVLTIWPGDTVQTTTIDSGGVDENGVTQALFGNPQTGPFFIAGAMPGDTLVIHLKRLTLNRDYADSLDTIVRRALGYSLIPSAGELGNPIRWVLDREAGVARPQDATGALESFTVPLRPMLGGLGVAPGFGWPALSTGDTGRFGGNMDFSEVREGNTVYLTVQQPGALLYLGDAHALQGDGETSQYGLETSMEIEFSIDIIKDQSINIPRVESNTQIMVIGQAGSLDNALKSASTGMIQWLQQDYGLSLSQVAQVMGSSIQYNVATLAARNVGMVARINKSLLPPSKSIVSRWDKKDVP